MKRPIFGFPNPVNEVAARSVATGVVIICIVTIAAQLPWLSIVLAYGFVARVAAGPRFSPLGRIATQVVAPRLSRHARMVPGPPKRFAQAVGALFSLAALGSYLAGETTATYVLVGLLVIPAGLEAALGLCLGCEIFKVAMRRGLIPTSVCEECADLWGDKAVSRRRQRGDVAEDLAHP